MTTFLVILLIVFPIVAIAVWLRQKEGARRSDTASKEAEFLSAMRANPTAAIGPDAPAAIAPLLVSSVASRSLEEAPSSGSKTQSTDRAGSSAGAGWAAASSAPPKDGHCMVCKENVDMRSNDAKRWGVKIPEPGANRLIWVHFHCLSARLEEARALREAIEQMIAAIDQRPDMATPALKGPLDRARALTGG